MRQTFFCLSCPLGIPCYSDFFLTLCPRVGASVIFTAWHMWHIFCFSFILVRLFNSRGAGWGHIPPLAKNAPPRPPSIDASGHLRRKHQLNTDAAFVTQRNGGGLPSAQKNHHRPWSYMQLWRLMKGTMVMWSSVARRKWQKVIFYSPKKWLHGCTCCRSSGYLFVEENLTFLPTHYLKKTTSLLLSGGPISPPNATVAQSSLYSLENWPPAERHAAVFLSLSALFQLMSKVADNNVKHSFSSHNICLSHVLLLLRRRNGGAEWAFFFLCLVWVKNAVVRMKCAAADCWVLCEGQLMPLSWWLQRLIEKNTLSIWPLGRKNSKCSFSRS